MRWTGYTPVIRKARKGDSLMVVVANEGAGQLQLNSVRTMLESRRSLLPALQ